MSVRSEDGSTLLSSMLTFLHDFAPLGRAFETLGAFSVGVGNPNGCQRKTQNLYMDFLGLTTLRWESSMKPSQNTERKPRTTYVRIFLDSPTYQVPLYLLGLEGLGDLLCF